MWLRLKSIDPISPKPHHSSQVVDSSALSFLAAKALEVKRTEEQQLEEEELLITEEEEDLGWFEAVDDAGRKYYWHRMSLRSVWRLSPGVSMSTRKERRGGGGRKEEEEGDQEDSVAPVSLEICGLSTTPLYLTVLCPLLFVLSSSVTLALSLAILS